MVSVPSGTHAAATEPAMKPSDFDHIPSDLLRSLRDGCKTVAEKFAGEGDRERACAAWVLWQLYGAALESRQGLRG